MNRLQTSLFAFGLLLIGIERALSQQGTREPSAPVASVSTAELGLPPLDQELLPQWVELILPSETETKHETIPWLYSFSEGMLAAASSNKPMLFWAMNGHPLGCT
ncbi:MAG: hypothetical protein ACI841_002558 [Planctomycetota bacterium]|jgi:hypothetical protein